MDFYGQAKGVGWGEVEAYVIVVVVVVVVMYND